MTPQWLHFSKPQSRRDYAHAGLLFATPVLAVIGLIALGFAISFQGYIGALILLALAGCTFVGAQELRPKEPPAPPAVADSKPVSLPD